MQLELYAWTPPDVVAVPLRRKNGSVRAFAWVDAEDGERVNAHRWFLRNTGYVMRSAYRRGPTIHLHRFVMRLEDPALLVDHRNHRLLDNRKRNLRVVTEAQNRQNLSAGGYRGSSSLYRGVSWSTRRQKWTAEGKVGEVRAWLGYFDDEEEAARVVAAFRRENMPYSKEAA